MDGTTGNASHRGTITDEAVAAMAAMAGIDLVPERVPLVAERLRDMQALAAELAEFDLDGYEPDTRFDPSWPDEATS